MTHPKRDLKDINFKTINDYSLQIIRWCLKSIALWPLTNTLIEKFITVILIIFWSSTMTIVLIPCILYVLLEDSDIAAKLGAIGPLINRIVGWISYWMLLKSRRDIRNCIRHMETDWQLVREIEDRETMLQYAKFGRFITGISAMITQGGNLLFGTARAIKTATIIVNNQTFTMHPPTCPAYSKIIDTRFSPMDEIMLAMQYFSAFALSFAVVGVCSFAGIFAMHACGQLNVLCIWLNKFVENYGKEKTNSTELKLASIVEHHLRVLSFIANVESIMHKICLVIIMGATLDMCFLGYYAILNWAAFDSAKILSYFLVYTSMGFNVFIFCYIGEILTEQCKKVGQIVYMTNWYQLPHKTALCLILIIIRSSNVIRMTAGKLIYLSIATFGDVIKTSVTYLNILRTMIA